jgi:hypothetical protein
MRLANPLHELVQSFLHVPQYGVFAGRVPYLVSYLRWRSAALRGERLPWSGEPRITVVLLSYKRVHNMDTLVRNLLRADCVQHLVVSNNNPDYRISDWVQVEDARLRLVDQPRRTPPGIRFELARQAPGDYFISVDDDVLLYPEQLESLFKSLLAQPEVPHGVQGEKFLGRSGTRRAGPFGDWQPGCFGETEADVINTVYTFTRKQLEALYRLASALGKEVATLANGEDVLLSMSGQGRPRVHDVGAVGQCLSWCRAGVATWRSRQAFFQERTVLFESLQALKASSPPSR